MGEYRLTYDQRPWTVNAERAGGKGGRGVGGHFGRASLVQEWREAFAWLAMAQRVPHLKYVDVVVLQSCRDKRMPDPGACFPAYKAALDGLVDAGVLDEDDGRYVRSVMFLAPRALGRDSLTLNLKGPRATT